MKLKVIWGLLTLLLFLIPSLSEAQIVIGPTSKLQWDVVNMGVVLTYDLVVDSSSPVNITDAICAASVPPVTNQQTCNIPLVPRVPIGTHTLLMSARQGTLVSTPSAPFAYTTLLIPIPTNLKISRTWYGRTRYEWNG